jgi:flagellar assembly protein FliH
MSSKIRHEDETTGVEQMAWRQMNSSGPARQAVAAGPSPDSLEFAARLRECEKRVGEARAAGVGEGKAAGVREGEAAGRQRAAAEVQPVIDRLARSIEEMAGLRARLRAEAEGDLIKLSLAIARRVIRRELAIDPEALHGLILGALEKLQGQDMSRVRVHPSHVALVTASLRQNMAAAKVDVVADPARPVGTVIFETRHGNLDASVETQLQEIERGLADRLKKNS